jgi:hypothetical protein
MSPLRRWAREARLQLRRRLHACGSSTGCAGSRDILFWRDSQSHGALAGGTARAAEGNIGKAVFAVICCS